MMSALKIIAGFTLLFTAVGAQAQSKNIPSVITDVLNCRSQKDEQARLRCFDQATDLLATASSNGGLIVMDKAEVKKAQRGLFGFSLPKLGFLTGNDNNSDDIEVDELATYIQSVSPSGHEFWLITLEEGGTWQTIEEPSRLFEPQVSQQVVIKRGPLGNFRMAINGRRAVGVRRVR